jgi:hypothetical protein
MRQIFNMKWSILMLAALLSAGSLPAPAAQPPPSKETRYYSILVDGKAAGSCQMTVADQADGSRCLAVNAEVRVKHLVFTYRYSFTGTEIWKDGALLGIDCAIDDDGKKTRVAGFLDGQKFRVAVNGKASECSPPHCTTIYAQFPASAKDGAALNLLDTDTGELQRTQLQDLGPSETKVGDQVVPTRHWRCAVKEKVHLWYDAKGVLQRLTMVEDGHPTEWIRTIGP